MAPTDQTTPRRAQKSQPWLSHRPDIKSRSTLDIDYGVKKGERMAIAGTAGSFFAHGDWAVEKDTQTIPRRRSQKKSQPWLSHRPDMIKSEDTLGIDYGCAKGERIAVPGSAVSLHAHGGWKVEKDTKGSSFG